MAGVNKVIIIGRLGNDPASKFFSDNSQVTNMSVATSTDWKDKATGEKKSKTEWHRVVAYKKLADIASKYLKKGSKVYIEGSLQTKSWEKDGETRYTTEIIARSIQMLDRVDNNAVKEVTDSVDKESASFDDVPF